MTGARHADHSARRANKREKRAYEDRSVYARSEKSSSHDTGRKSRFNALRDDDIDYSNIPDQGGVPLPEWKRIGDLIPGENK